IGHILHLIQDMSVPAHTRNDAHPNGDPFEEWVEKYGNVNLEKVNFIKVDNLDSAFDSLANYSNNNFYSKDTIQDVNNIVSKKKIKINNETHLYVYCKDNFNNKFICLREVQSPIENFYKIDDLRVHHDYWNMLYPQAVGYSAGAIDYFIKEFEKIDEEKSAQKKLSVWSKIKNGLEKNQFDRVKYVFGDTFFAGRKRVTKIWDDTFSGAKKAFIYSKFVAESGKEVATDAAKKATDGAAKIASKIGKNLENASGKVLSAVKKDDKKALPPVSTQDFAEPKNVDTGERGKEIKTDAKDKIDLVILKPNSLIKKEIKKIENYSNAELDYVIDGDTIVLTSGERVRYIGIDTPELRKPGPQDDECLAWVARIRNLQLLETGELKLAKDPSVDKDKYGRLLRYVYSGNIFINERLALEGLAETFFCKPGWKNCPVTSDLSRRNSIETAFNSAKQNSRGLFSEVCNEKIVKKAEEKKEAGDKDEKSQIDSPEKGEFVVKKDNPSEQKVQVKSSNFVFFGGGGGDTESPITTIIKKPNNPSNSDIAEFEFSASEEAVFNCRLDSDEWQACFSPVEYAELSSGTHIFMVEAVDSADNIELNSPEYEWEIDLSIPVAPIILYPPEFPYYASGTPLLISGSNNSDFEVLISGSAEITRNSSSSWQSLIDLSEGENIFNVKSEDRFGEYSDANEFKIILDIIAPVVEITKAPLLFSSSTKAYFEVAAKED
ncbi:MAG: thermonuclease family protein, partial [Patescibacteria group bacterium]|nr:thermonuclease family protein [Patescibacteria group bacterium]